VRRDATTKFRGKYHHREPGFFRINCCGWRFVIYDSRIRNVNSRFHIPWSVREYGKWIGPYVVRLESFDPERLR
jgi:hypothetical protein